MTAKDLKMKKTLVSFLLSFLLTTHRGILGQPVVGLEPTAPTPSAFPPIIPFPVADSTIPTVRPTLASIPTVRPTPSSTGGNPTQGPRTSSPTPVPTTTSTTAAPTPLPTTWAPTVQLFFNEAGYETPEFRYVLWETLSPENKTIAGSLGYDAESWENLRTLELEFTAFSDLKEKQIATVRLGFEEDTWDCWINHYDGYDWAELVEFDEVRHFEALGWTKQAWESDDQGDWPESESKTWDELSDEEKQAAADICFFDETWDNLPFVEWVETSPFLFPPAPRPFFICFPEESSVMVKDVGVTKLSNLQIGDQVLVENGIYEPVYSFGHYDLSHRYPFLKISTEVTSLTMSNQHMVFAAQKGFIPASSVEIGDNLLKADGTPTKVTKIESVERKGAIAPFTPSGRLIVDGNLVSSFIAYQESSTFKLGSIRTPLTYQDMAHTFESFHRMAYFSLGMVGESYTADGISVWVADAHKVGLWLLRQHVMVQCFGVGALSIIFVVINMVEILVRSPMALAVALLTIYTCRHLFEKETSKKT